MVELFKWTGEKIVTKSIFMEENKSSSLAILTPVLGQEQQGRRGQRRHHHLAQQPRRQAADAQKLQPEASLQVRPSAHLPARPRRPPRPRLLFLSATS